MKQLISRIIIGGTIFFSPFIIAIYGGENAVLYKSPLTTIYEKWFDMYMFCLLLLLIGSWMYIVDKIVNYLLQDMEKDN